MDVYDGTNQCTPSIGYLIFGVEDGFLLDGIYFFLTTPVLGCISFTGLFRIWYKVCDEHSGAVIQDGRR